MKNHSVLLNKPQEIGLIEYFNSLNVFDKRNLINELLYVKKDIDESLKSSAPYFLIMLMFCVLGTLINPIVSSFIIFSIISVFFGSFFLRELLKSLRFKFIISHMNKNM